MKGGIGMCDRGCGCGNIADRISSFFRGLIIGILVLIIIAVAVVAITVDLGLAVLIGVIALLVIAILAIFLGIFSNARGN